jgi:uncharacterized caspase-like protein
MNKVHLSIFSIVCGVLLMGPWFDAALGANKRVALVIGNSGYQHAPKLDNPLPDATAIAEMFKSAGFDVYQRNNLAIVQFKRILREFMDAADNADVAVVYFAGHGIEVGGRNYLIPVDAKLDREYDARDEAVGLDRVFEAVDNVKRLRLIILDACRDNPFVKRMHRQFAQRAISNGLAPVETAGTETLVAFAAKAGSTAEDGAGSHSPYTTALLKYLREPGLDVRIAFGRVRDEVVKTTRGRQEPYLYGSLGGDTISLVPAPEVKPAASTTVDADAQIRRDYEAARQVATVKAWDAFLAAHPSGLYATLAGEERAKLASRTAEREKAEREAALQQNEEQRRTKADEERQKAISSPARTDSPAQSFHDRLVARFAALSISENLAREYETDVQNKTGHKAVAIAPRMRGIWKTWNKISEDAAVTVVLESCQFRFREPCVLIAVNDKVEPTAGNSERPRDMPRLRYAGAFEPEQIPSMDVRRLRREDIRSYRSASGAKAAAFHPAGVLFIVRADNQFKAEESVLAQCNDDLKGRDGPCFLYAVANNVVLPQRYTTPLSPDPSNQQSQQARIPSFRDSLVARLTALSVASGEAEARVRNYETENANKAMAVAVKARLTWRTSSRSSEQAAISSALEGCQVFYGEPCTLVAVGDTLAEAADGAPKVRDMQRTQYAGRFEPERIPFDGSLSHRADIGGYRSAIAPKAAAYHPWGNGWVYTVTNAGGQFEAEEQVLAQCNDDPQRKGQNGPCFLYAVGNRVVLPQRLTKPRPRPQTISEAFDYLGLPRGLDAYFSEKGHKAMAFALESGQTFRWSAQTSAAAAEQKALEGCQLSYATQCVLLARDDVLVASDPWKASRRDMARLHYDGSYNRDNVPLFSGTEDLLRSYATDAAPKAMAIRPKGGRVRTATGASSAEAQLKALAACNDDSDPFPCFIYAVDDRVILSQRRTEPLR